MPLDLWLMLRDLHFIVLAIHGDLDERDEAVVEVFLALIRYFTPHALLWPSNVLEHGDEDFTATLAAIVNWAKQRLNRVRAMRPGCAKASSQLCSDSLPTPAYF